MDKIELALALEPDNTSFKLLKKHLISQITEQKLNLSGADRKNVQRGLETLGFYINSIDGIFGENTRKAIMAYQNKYKFEPTGYLLSNVYDKILSDAHELDEKRRAKEERRYYQTPKTKPESLHKLPESIKTIKLVVPSEVPPVPPITPQTDTLQCLKRKGNKAVIECAGSLEAAFAACRSSLSGPEDKTICSELHQELRKK